MTLTRVPAGRPTLPRRCTGQAFYRTIKALSDEYNSHPRRIFLQIRYAAVDALLPPLLLRHLRLLAAMPGLRCNFCKQVRQVAARGGRWVVGCRKAGCAGGIRGGSATAFEVRLQGLQHPAVAYAASRRDHAPADPGWGIRPHRGGSLHLRRLLLTAAARRLLTLAAQKPYESYKLAAALAHAQSMLAYPPSLSPTNSSEITHSPNPAHPAPTPQAMHAPHGVTQRLHVAQVTGVASGESSPAESGSDSEGTASSLDGSALPGEPVSSCVHCGRTFWAKGTPAPAGSSSSSAAGGANGGAKAAAGRQAGGGAGGVGEGAGLELGVQLAGSSLWVDQLHKLQRRRLFPLPEGWAVRGVPGPASVPRSTSGGSRSGSGGSAASAGKAEAPVPPKAKGKAKGKAKAAKAAAAAAAGAGVSKRKKSVWEAFEEADPQTAAAMEEKLQKLYSGKEAEGS